MSDSSEKIKPVSVFVVRCKPHDIIKEDEFLKGTLSVGWPSLGNLTGMTREQIEPIFNSSYPSHGPIRLSQLYNFITIPKGTAVLTPSVYNRDVHLFITTSGYIYNKEQDIFDNNADNKDKGNPHQIKARFIKTLAREDFSTKLQAALNAAKRTVTNLSVYMPEIEAILNNEKVENTDNKYRDEALETLSKLLKSEDENIRLQAAINILKSKE